MGKDVEKAIERARKKIGPKSDLEVEKWEQGLELIQKKTQVVKEYIAKQPEQSVFSFMPNALTRVSPFFPLNRKESKNRPLERLSWKTSWGSMEVKGERLSIYDESVLLSLLVLMRKYKSKTFTVSRYEICKVLNVKPQQHSYTAIWDSLIRLIDTTIRLKVKDKFEIASPILSGSLYDDRKHDITLTINDYFYEMYVEGLLANINLSFRSSLAGNYSKALYRFYVGQSGADYKCHLLTLAKVINLDLDLPPFEIRKRIRKGLKELRAKNYLKRWKIDKSDLVQVWKSLAPQK